MSSQGALKMTDATQKLSAKAADRAGTITETAAPGLQKGNGIQMPMLRPSGAIAPVQISEGGVPPGSRHMVGRAVMEPTGMGTHRGLLAGK